MYSEAESSLISACLLGNRKAQQTIYTRYCDAMYNVCYRMMGTSADAEDALQESFIDVFRSLHSFRGDSTLGAWIKRIVINHCINALQRRKIVFEEMTDSNAGAYYEDENPSEDATYEVQKVRDAIMKLPNGYRQVLTLYLLEGYDHAEIGSILGIQESGSKSQYSRAKTKLRQILNQAAQ